MAFYPNRFGRQVGVVRTRVGIRDEIDFIEGDLVRARSEGGVPIVGQASPRAPRGVIPAGVPGHIDKHRQHAVAFPAGKDGADEPDEVVLIESGHENLLPSSDILLIA